MKKKLSEETDSDKRDMYQRMLTKVTTAIGTASAAVDGPSTLEDAARQVTLSSVSTFVSVVQVTLLVAKSFFSTLYVILFRHCVSSLNLSVSNWPIVDF